LIPSKKLPFFTSHGKMAILQQIIKSGTNLQKHIWSQNIITRMRLCYLRWGVPLDLSYYALPNDFIIRQTQKYPERSRRKEIVLFPMIDQ
jgi:hypothetical protein